MNRHKKAQDTYIKPENGAANGLKKLENDAKRSAAAADDFLVGKLFLEPGETVEQARQRLSDRRAQSKEQAEQVLQEMGDNLADLYLKIEDGIYDAYKALETGALKATDALMDFCENILLPDDESKPSEKE